MRSLGTGERGANVGAIFLAWTVSAALLLVFAAWLGYLYVRPAGIFGILIDSRGRFSLTHLQLVLWTVVVLSLVAGVFFGRLWAGVDDPLGFDIPAPLLGVLGISVGSAVTASVVKASKDLRVPERVKASMPGSADNPPSFGQVLLVEEGPFADQVIDIGKFQNFSITLIAVVAYVALAISAIRNAGTAADVRSLPTFTPELVALIGISHAGYIGGKLSSPGPRDATAPGLTVRELATARDDRAPPVQPYWRR